MSVRYRVSDDDKELGPFDIGTIQGMFYRGSISNKAKYREAGGSDPWRMITTEFPQWGKGHDTAIPKRGDRRRMARAARPPKHFRSRPLGWACFVVAILLWVIPFAYPVWMDHVININSVREEEEQRLAHQNGSYFSQQFTRLDAEKRRALYQQRIDSVGDSGRTFFFWITLPGSGLLFWWGRRLRSVSAETLLAQDTRPPVVYFRSFQDDLKFVVPINKRGGILGRTKYRTEEEQIVKQLKRIGPVIAIGDPRETIPLAGASRLYINDDTWPAVAEQLLASASLVVYRFATTPGFLWEVKRGREHIKPERFLLLIPKSKHDVFYSGRYTRFREQIANTLNLPETLDGPIISFRHDWTPEIYSNGFSNFYKRLRDFASSRVSATSKTATSPAFDYQQKDLLTFLRNQKGSQSDYDYSGSGIRQAGYVAVVYGVIFVAGAIFGSLGTPSAWWIRLTGLVIPIVIVIGLLAFGIFKKSRVAVVLMIVLVVGNQLFTWILLRSFTGIVVCLIVTGFLIRGAKRIFEKHRKFKLGAASGG